MNKWLTRVLNITALRVKPPDIKGEDQTDQGELFDRPLNSQARKRTLLVLHYL